MTTTLSGTRREGPPHGVRVTSVEPRGGDRLSLQFSDGLAGEVDLESRLFGEVFESLRDLDLFRQVRVNPELDTITWPNGADFAPEFLHAAVRGAAAEVAGP